MGSWLGIDASTQSVSAILVADDGSVLAEESVNFGAELPAYSAPHGFIPDGPDGEVHADPLMWLDALELCLQKLRANGAPLDTIAGISGAGQQHGTVYLNDRWPAALAGLGDADSLSQALKPTLSRKTSPIWMDVSTGQQCEEIAKAAGGRMEVCRRSGSTPVERFSGPQIRRFERIDPEGYAETARIHLVSSFLASVLAGAEAPVDHGDGAGMNLLNLESLDWDPVLLEATATGLHDRLPPAKPSGTVVGSVSSYFSKKFGIPDATPVVAFTGDNPSSLVGMGAASPGSMVVSLGTSDTVFAAMPKPKTDPEGFGHVFGNPMGGFMCLVCFRNGSLAREAIRDRLGGDWVVFEPETLDQTPPGNDGNGMVPFFGHEINPRVDCSEPIRFGSPDFLDNPSTPALARACLEGQFLNLRRQTRWIGIAPERLLLTGGASANDGIAQTLADVTGIPVERLAVSGSVATGAVLRAAEALGGNTTAMKKKLCAPDPASRREPRKDVEKAYAKLEEAFAGVIGKLRKI